MVSAASRSGLGTSALGFNPESYSNVEEVCAFLACMSSVPVPVDVAIVAVASIKSVI